MNLLTGAVHLWRVGSEATHAIQAAEDALQAGGSPVAALRAFAAATPTTVDDAAVAVVEQALVQVVHVVKLGAKAAAVMAVWVPRVQDGLGVVLDGVLGLAYQASRWGRIVDSWRE